MTYRLENPKIQAIYWGAKWKRVRKLKKLKENGLCERCKKRGIYKEGSIVHHKIYITDKNYTNPNIVYNLDNLELLCIDCHSKEHRDPYYFDEEGNLCGKESSYSSTTSRYKEIV